MNIPLWFTPDLTIKAATLSFNIPDDSYLARRYQSEEIQKILVKNGIEIDDYDMIFTGHIMDFVKSNIMTQKESNSVKILSEILSENLIILPIFGKVSEKEWESCSKSNPDIGDYNDIKLPRRATKGSAGYDIFSNESVVIYPGQSHIFSTGINILMKRNNVLSIYPRSGLGFKYQAQLANTVGIIDSDYICSDNNGHIKIKIVNCGTESITIDKGQAFAQGIITEYNTTYDDDVKEVRNGGFGSTGN